MSRKIRQVVISEEGKEETSEERTIESKEPDKKDNKKSDKKDDKKSDRKSEDKKEDNSEEKKPHHLSDSNRTIRIIAIAVAMVFSLVLAMCVGAGLALWDGNRSVAELRAALFGIEVAAATDPSEDATGAITVDEPEEAGPTPTPEPEPIEEEDYGQTISADTDGLSDVAKAGSDDEIVIPSDSDVPAVLDPTANYPLPFSTVDESYFTDALFIGDSRLQGFGFWSGLPATYYCATGFQLYKYDSTNVVQTENGKVPIFNAMPYDAFTKIYIKVGLNELGYGTEENFEKKYAELIAKLREYEPRAIIYVHGILPVTAAKSEKDKAHNKPNIVKRNASLEQFAKDQKAYYLDAGPVLSDEDGNLRPEMTSDGIHLKPEYMKIWREFLCENAVE